MGERPYNLNKAERYWDELLNVRERIKEKEPRKAFGSMPSKKSLDEEKMEMMMEEMRENERRRKFGLPDTDEERLFGEGSSTIVKEKGGLALIRHHDPDSPASESPTMFEIRDDKGEPIWKEGITPNGRICFPGFRSI